jgi:hypothetical protein
VFLVDSKQYSGRLQVGSSGRLWHGHYPLAPRIARAGRLRPTKPPRSWPIRKWRCRSWLFTAPRSPGQVVMDRMPVVPARRLPSMLRALPELLEPERIASLADQARVRFHAAA